MVAPNDKTEPEVQEVIASIIKSFPAEPGNTAHVPAVHHISSERIPRRSTFRYINIVHLPKVFGYLIAFGIGGIIFSALMVIKLISKFLSLPRTLSGLFSRNRKK
jgi:hypothetical protein